MKKALLILITLSATVPKRSIWSPLWLWRIRKRL